MRWYVIDDLSAEDTARVAEALQNRGLEASLQGLYWLPVPEEQLTPLQAEHRQSCGPHVLALEVEEHSLRLELLVRAQACLRCDCVHYAEPEQRAWGMGYLDQLLQELHISV